MARHELTIGEMYQVSLASLYLLENGAIGFPVEGVKVTGRNSKWRD